MKLKTSLLITVATGTFLCASSVVSYAGTSTPDTMGLFRKKKKTESNDSIKSKNEYEKLTGDGSIVRRGMFNVYQKKNNYYFEQIAACSRRTERSGSQSRSELWKSDGALWAR